MSEILKYKLSYTGEDADHSRLPAHNGAISIEGMTWSFSIISHYAATGKIKTRGELSPRIKTFLVPARRGSYLQELWVWITEPENLFMTSVIGSYTVSTVGQIVNSLIASSIRRVCGLEAGLSTAHAAKLDKLPSGDREALIDRIEPSMRRAHEVIEDGASTLRILKGTTPLVTLDRHTKAYVNTDILTDEKVITAGVGAYNANTGNGSVYLPDIGKTVPFFVPKGLHPNTYAALSYSLDRYVNNLPSYIQIACVESVSVDSRVKKLKINHAFKGVEN